MTLSYSGKAQSDLHMGQANGDPTVADEVTCSFRQTLQNECEHGNIRGPVSCFRHMEHSTMLSVPLDANEVHAPSAIWKLGI